ncbi:S-adenosyl-L-methionine-dependent methyltransferase [Karstenula rhodostoma CBS 690.94]|uniref:S-adenosyl-L-methionine-dependent methyltransferase n=1 Tax=Karstenula rhodostoma CBS 690.94 TaxID=1392251 RepID=A0A9P4PG16_9PLEO|nr:S-adenosyl-L-methionine-dependent methyltransferase [Karstenula rhodostoma CBS 690.94]
MSALTELAAIASTEAQKLTNYITSNNLPLPSFEVDAPGELPIPSTDEDLQASRIRLLKAAQDLQALALGPAEDLRWKAWNQYNDNISLHAIMHFRLPEAVPVNGTATFAEISQKTGLKEPLVMRFVRHAAIYHVFKEVSSGVVAHTAGSVALLDGSSVRDWLDMTFEEWGPASVNAVKQLIQSPDSGEQSDAGFALAFGGQTIFEFLAERPDRARVFGLSMSNFSKGASHKVEHLITNYDWPALGESTIVDLGGSHGHISLAIAAAHPKLKFVVEDLPGTTAQGEEMLPAEYKDRISFIGHNLNDPQPYHGADLYMFRSVLLNWPDQYVVKFIKNLVPALKPGAKVLINEGVLPQPGEVSDWDYKVLTSLDLCMLAMFNSKERTVEEWEGLFKEADPRFAFQYARKPEGSLLWIIEAVWQPTVSP